MTEKIREEKTDEKAKGEAVKHKDANTSRQQDDELEEGLEESMPASDPPASTQPGDKRPQD